VDRESAAVAPREEWADREERRTGYGEAEAGSAGSGGDDGSTGRPDAPEGPGGAWTAAAELRCDLCGAPVLDRHCKIVCLNCGYQRDCSDP
jgi:hypothetical protein